jgi:hypothetical protein
MKSCFNFKSGKWTSLIHGLFFLLTFMATSLPAQTLTVQSPNGGEFWTYGQTEIVTWTGENLGSAVKVEFSNDGGTNWYYVGNVPTGPNGGSATVGVPAFPTTNGLVKITDVGNTTVTDMSDEPFTIFIPPIVVYEPNSASVIFAESETLVYWILSIFDFTMINAEISLDNGSTFTPVAQNIDVQLGYIYLTLSDTPSDSCILKLYNADDPTEYGMSEVFKINPLPVYTLTSPATGELVNANNPYTITWTVENPYSAYCYLEYSANNGQTWEVINNAASQGNSGSYEWYTPPVNSEECLVRITDSYAITSSDISGMFTIFPFPETPVCMVSVDSLTNFNVIIWEKPVTDIIADFLVYKETDEANVYEVIDTVAYEEITMVTDPGSNPGMRPYRYKVGFIDVENRLFPAGDYHQTIHLTISQGVNFAWNLIWTSYIGFEYSSYKIMRKTDSGDYVQIATVSASFNSFTDFNAPPGEVYYMIKIEHPDGCDPATRDGEFASVYSNVASNTLVSVTESKLPDFGIYPNPADKQINISFGENITGTASVVISDMTGRVVYSEVYNDVRSSQVQPINSLGFKEGMYLLRVTSGENTAIRKIMIKH